MPRYRGVAGDGKRSLRGWKRFIGRGGGRCAWLGVATVSVRHHQQSAQHTSSGGSIRPPDGRRLLPLLLELERLLLLLFVQGGVSLSAEVVPLTG